MGRSTKDRELVFTRVFDAPRELVWKVWTEPDHVAQWWGPFGFTTSTETMDVRKGGVWRFVMHGPDGRDYPNRIHYLEVSKPARLVYRHSGEDDVEPVEFEVTVTFEEQHGRTAVAMRMLFPTAEDLARVVREYGAEEGAHQTLSRLGAHLGAIAAREATAATERDFVISRVFDAPRDLVWKAWTEPARMARWWGPYMITGTDCNLDVRPGGAYRIVMRDAGGVEYPATGVYREVVAPERLVMTMDTSGHSEEWKDMVNPDRPKGSDPVGELINTVTLEAVGNRTRLTIRTRFASAAIRDAMVKMGMSEGWSQSLEKLAEGLARRAG